MSNLYSILQLCCLSLCLYGCDAKQQRADHVEQSIASSEQEQKPQTEN